MPFKLKSNAPFIYDENDNLVGVKNANGTNQRFFPKVYNSATAVSAVSAASTFTTLTADFGSTSSNHISITSSGNHSLTSASDSLGVYVTWDGTGGGVNGIYPMTYMSATQIEILHNRPWIINSGVQISVANAIVKLNHGYALNDPLRLTTTGTLPTGFALATTYYVNQILGSSRFTVSATIGGPTIYATAAGTGVHTATTYYGVPTVGLITTNIPVASFTVGEGEISRTGYMNLSALFTLVSNANNKTIIVQYGGVDWVNTGTLTASMTSVNIFKSAYARTPTTLVSPPAATLGSGIVNSANLVITKDYSLPQTLNIFVKSGTVNEAITLENYLLEAY